MNSPVVVPPPWKIWQNPIFRRYCRSRLRPKQLSVWLGIVVLISGFIFVQILTGTVSRGQFATVDAARTAIMPLYFIQAFLLFILGTGQVAAGVTAERDEGTLDYQHLTPLTPLTKVLGYLFGLPIREYLLVFALMPFMLWGFWAGEVPLSAWLPLYLVGFSSAVGYHLTGLLTGTVVKNRRWAFLVSIGLVFFLYAFVPQISRFGLVCFKYLTVWPVATQVGPLLLPSKAGAVVLLNRVMEPEVRFFGFGFPEVVFTLSTQAALILTFVTMLCRRWRQAESHLLSKVWAVGIFAWVQILLLGNALPLIESGQLFPSREIRRRVTESVTAWTPTLGEALGMIGIFGLVAMFFMAVLTLIITPTEDGQVRGLRRARKLGLPRVPALSDAASSLWFVAAIAVVGGLSWAVFSHALISSKWFAGTPYPAHAPWTFVLILLSSGIGFQALLEGWNGRWPFVTALLASIVPVMFGMILGTANDNFIRLSIWLAGASPAAAPFFGAQTLFPASVPSDFNVVPYAFWTWQAVIGGAAIVLSLILAKRHRQRRAAAQL